VAAYLFMDNLSTARNDARAQLRVLRHKPTWVMSLLYIGTFGSFIGYSAAMPLLIKLNFWVPEPRPLGTGIYFAYYAFLGALVGSATRPVGGWLADRFGGARVTLAAFGGIIASTLGVLWTLGRLVPNPSADPGIAAQNQGWFPLFLGFFLLIFAATGIGNGSTYKMIPAIFRTEAVRSTSPGTPQRAAALVDANRQSSAAIGFVGAVGALGGFLIPITFSAPWVADPLTATRSAFIIFTVFYVFCAALTWFAYLRRPVGARVEAGLAGAGI